MRHRTRHILAFFLACCGVFVASPVHAEEIDVREVFVPDVVVNGRASETGEWLVVLDLKDGGPRVAIPWLQYRAMEAVAPDQDFLVKSVRAYVARGLLSPRSTQQPEDTVERPEGGPAS